MTKQVAVNQQLDRKQVVVHEGMVYMYLHVTTKSPRVVPRRNKFQV